MIQERGLAPATVLRYENTARRFLSEQATTGGAFAPAALTGTDINAFLLRECGRVSTGSAKGRVVELRTSLLPPLRAATYATVIGLSAPSGLRIGKAIKLDRGDVDWAEGVLLIRESKFGKSRLVPLHASTIKALERYARLRDELMRKPKDPSFFVSRTGKRLLYAVVSPTFRQLINDTGVGLDALSPPRLHDLRHTFAVRTLLGWYRARLVMVGFGRFLGFGMERDELLGRLRGWRLIDVDRVPGEQMAAYVSGPAPLRAALKKGRFQPLRYELERIAQ